MHYTIHCIFLHAHTHMQVGGLLALHSATILSAKTQDSEEITVSENENEKENEKPA